MKKVVAGLCIAAVLIVGGIVAFVVAGSDDETASPEPTRDSEAPTAATGSPTPFVLPTASLPADAEDARLLMEINQIIFEVTQQAAQRPRDQRMTAEEIDALIRSRIEELKARR